MEGITLSSAASSASAANAAQVSIAKKQSKQLETVVGTLIASAAATPTPAVEGKGGRLDVYA